MSTLRAMWGHRDFRSMWIGQSLSVIGDHMIWVVLALYVTETTGSGRDMGIVLAAQSAPLILLLLVGGVVADRLPRQRIVVATDLVRGAVQIAIAILVFTGEPPIWLLSVLVAAFGAAEAFFRPAIAGLIPQTVPEALIQEAQAMMHTANTVARFLGPAIGTLLSFGIGFGIAYLVDAATFVVSAVFLAMVVARPRGEAVERDEPSLRREIVAGYREVRSRAWVWIILLCAFIIVFAGVAPFMALGALVAERVFGDSAMFGWAGSATGVGAIAGALLAVRWRPRRPLALGLAFMTAWSVQVTLYAVGASRPLVLTACAFGGFSFTVFIVWWETALAERIPPHALSRVASYDWMVSLAFMPVGYLLAGFLSEHVRPERILLVAAAVVAVVQFATIAMPAVWGFTRLERGASETA